MLTSPQHKQKKKRQAAAARAAAAASAAIIASDSGLTCWCMHCAAAVAPSHKAKCPTVTPGTVGPCKDGCFFPIVDYPQVVEAQKEGLRAAVEQAALREKTIREAAARAGEQGGGATGSAGGGSGKGAKKRTAPGPATTPQEPVCDDEEGGSDDGEGEPSPGGSGSPKRTKTVPGGEKTLASVAAANVALRALADDMDEVASADVSTTAKWRQVAVRLGVIFGDINAVALGLIRLQGAEATEAVMSWFQALAKSWGTKATAEEPGGAALWRNLSQFDLSIVSRSSTALRKLTVSAEGAPEPDTRAKAGGVAGSQEEVERMIEVSLEDPDMSYVMAGTILERQTGVGSGMVKVKFVKTNFSADGVRVNYHLAVGANGVPEGAHTNALVARLGLPNAVVRDTRFRAEAGQHVSRRMAGRPLSVTAIDQLFTGGPPSMVPYYAEGLPLTSATIITAWQRMLRAQEILFTSADRIVVAMMHIGRQLEGNLLLSDESGTRELCDTWEHTVVAWFRHHNAQLDSHISAGGWTPDLVGLWTTETLAATAAMAVRTQSALMAGAGSHGVAAHHAASPAASVHGGFTPVAQRGVSITKVTLGAVPVGSPRGDAAVGTKQCRSWAKFGTCDWSGPSKCKFSHE